MMGEDFELVASAFTRKSITGDSLPAEAGSHTSFESELATTLVGWGAGAPGSSAPETIAITAGRESPTMTRHESETRVISRFTRAPYRDRLAAMPRRFCPPSSGATWKLAKPLASL